MKGHLREERGHYESGVALGAAAIAAGGAAYSANQQKKAQKEAMKQANRTTHTDQTTTTKTTGWDNEGLGWDLDFARQEARRLYDAGPVTFGGGGGGGRAAGPDLSKFPPGSTARPDGRVIGPNGKTVGQVAPTAAAKGGGGKAAGGGAKKDGRPSMATQAKGIAQQIIDTGRAGNPNLGAADDFVGRALAPGGMGGNEVNADLYNRLGNVSFDTGMDYLSSFLGGVDGVAKTPPADRQAQAREAREAARASAGYSRAATGAGPLGSGGVGGSTIGDSTQGAGTFNDFAKEVLNEKAFLNPDDPVIKDYLDALRRDMQEDLDAQLQDVGDEFEGVGMYGGSGLALERGRVRNEGLEDIGDAAAKALMEARGQGIDLMGQISGQVNQRDISGAQIRSAEQQAAHAASAASGAAAADREAQMQIARRGQDLDGIGMLLNYQTAGMNQLAGLGERLSADRFGAIGSMGAVDAARYGGLEKAYGVANNMAQQEAAARARQQQIDFQNRMAPQRHLDDYLSRLGFFNGLGSTTTQRTVGDNVVPPSGGGGAPNPYAAGAMAGLGAFGAAGGFNNIGTGGNRPVSSVYGPGNGSVGLNGGPYVQQPVPNGNIGIG